MDLGYFVIDPEIAAKTREAGATVEEVTLDWHEVFEAALAHFYVYFGYDQPDLMSVEEQALLSKPAREFPDYTRRLPRMGFADAEKYRAKMYEDMSAIFARYRLLISPSAALPAVAADLPVQGPPLRIDHQPIDPVWGWYPELSLQHARTPAERECALRADFERGAERRAGGRPPLRRGERSEGERGARTRAPRGPARDRLSREPARGPAGGDCQRKLG